MKKHVLVFGLILGSILAGHMVYMVDRVYNDPALMHGSDVIGYAAMVIVFSLTFFGIRNYRNKDLNGVITFGRAFKTGALIAFIGSSMYVIAWLFYYYLFVPDFIDKYTLHVITEATRDGEPAAQIAERTADMNQFKEWYKNPFFVVIATYAEVLPVGLIVALISSLILKKKAQTTPDAVA